MQKMCYELKIKKLKMKLIKKLINDISIIQIIGSTEKQIESICFDTREVMKGSLFVAQKGTKVDGHDYISQAIENGATCIVAERLPEKLDENTTYLQVKSSPKALALLACSFYDNPSRKLKLIGVTGTNGKTTTVTLLYRLFTNLGFKCGLISTVENKIGITTIESTHTTPDAIQINRLLSQMLTQGVEYCFMEASSHAIVQQRIDGLYFTGGIFTNLTHDHLDYHKTFKEYIAAKKLFFDNLPKTAFALSNIDDANGKVMLQNTQSQRKTYSLYSINCDFKAKVNEDGLDGMNLTIDNENVWFQLVGKFNAYNLLSIYAAAVLLGIDKKEALREMSLLESAEGRFSVLRQENLTVIVDYAHTPDALLNVLNTIQEIRKNNQKIITVIGCGGDRDKTKRPEMAKIAYKLSDKVIFTSDNPRTEAPNAIIDDMLAGISTENDSNVFVNADRKQAIKFAITAAQKSDIVLIAGKGHEKYQEINGVKYNFDDIEIAKQYLKIKN
jgi:UDP-N-acetylmuramoyl-L-alanyl-D-glutamate--2,6-diaminopimelate ligase